MSIAETKLNLSQPVYLQFNGRRFWEISLVTGTKTSIRYGKLTQGVEVEPTVKKVEKEHKSVDGCLAYVQRVFEVKKLKGYQGETIVEKKVSTATTAAPSKPGITVSVPMINILIANENKSDNSRMDEETSSSSRDTKVDESINCYLQLNTSWHGKSALIVRNKKSVDVITGNLGPRPNWQSSTTEFSKESDAVEYFSSEIEIFEGQKYEKSNGQFVERFEEYEKSKNNSLPIAAGSGLAVPSAIPSRRSSFNRGSLNDSRSNVSDFTDDNSSRKSSVDLSFDQKSDDDSIGFGGITFGSLGKPGKMEGSVLLAEAAPDDMDPTGWIGSEKMDGVRAVWTGSKFFSRNGNEFFPPDFFTKNFPKCMLDGELFTKRDDFQRCVSIVRNMNKKNDSAISDKWNDIVYLVYDAPNLNKPFKDRIEALRTQLPKTGSKFLRCLPHIVIKDRAHLEEQLDKTLESKGEGIMLRDPEAYYQHTRSKTLLKVKVFIDEEALVIGKEGGSGRCQGMMGAINCRLKNGIEFKIGSGFNDAQRRNPPKIGSTVTFKYQNLSKEGKPRFPIFLRIA